MNNLSKTVALVGTAATLLITGCGQNPFGPGSIGLSAFAKIATAVQKPAQINEEQGSKNNSKEMIDQGTGAAKRLAKTAAGAANPSWLDLAWIEMDGNDVAYCEKVTNKPSENDPDKVSTGTGKVVFTYSGVTSGLTPENIDTSLITGIKSFEFIGRETKNWIWKTEIDTVRLMISFSSTTLGDLKPGMTTAWGKNISSQIAYGRDDTASFYLDSLDVATSYQYGEGHFLDAHTGSDNTESRAFDFTMMIDHKNTYNDYNDNTGLVNFYLPYGTTGDSLYFTVNFELNYQRTGTIKKNGPTGPTLISFTRNEKTNIGTTTYYNDNGEVIGSDN